MLMSGQNLTLEELDTVFNVGNREHAKYYTEKLPWYLNKHILRRDVEPMAPLYQIGEFAERSNSMAGMDDKKNEGINRETVAQ